MVELKRVWGFVLHFGYAESSYVSKILIRHCGSGFDMLTEAIRDLSSVFLADYLEGLYKGTPSLDGFMEYLYVQPERNASAGPAFLWSQANCETWWAWDTLGELYPYLDHFYENLEHAEEIIAMHVDLDTIQDADFREELRVFQTAPSATENGGVDLEIWQNLQADKAFEPVVSRKDM